LQILTDSNNVDIIEITETWGKADMADGEMEIPGYKFYRKDRAAANNKKGGGVALYVRDTLSYKLESEHYMAQACACLCRQCYH